MSERLIRSVVYLVGFTGFGYILLQMMPTGSYNTDPKKIADQYPPSLESQNYKNMFRKKTD